MRLCDNHFEILKILIDILLNDNNTKNLSIALHDLGEFVRHYQRGRLYNIHLKIYLILVLLNVWVVKWQ